MSKVIPTVTRNAASKFRGRGESCRLRLKDGGSFRCGLSLCASLCPSTPTSSCLFLSPRTPSLIDTHFWRGFFFPRQWRRNPDPLVKSAQPIRSDERQRDEAPRPIEAEESARPERGTVIRTGPKLVRLQNVASGKLKKKNPSTLFPTFSFNFLYQS